MSIRFELDWQAPDEPESPEGVTFAALRVLLGGVTVTEVEDCIAQTLRDSVFVSAYPLARFMAENWWRLRWEPAISRVDAAWRLRHSVSAAGDGYNWPNLEFASDGETIHAQMKASQPSPTAQIRYVKTVNEFILTEVFEQSVDWLLDAVAGRLDARGHRETELSSLIDELRIERSDTELSRWRRLEAMAGYDPDEAPEEFIRALLGELDVIGWSSLQELTASSRSRALQDLTELREELRGHGIGFRVAQLGQLQKAVDDDVNEHSHPPWSRGINAARKARLCLGLNGEVVSNRRLAEIFDLPERLLETGAQSGGPFSATLHSDNAGIGRMIIDKRLATGRRFAVSRLLGDRLFVGDENERLSTATEAATARQKFQRAFAQELLCPFDSLMELLGSDSPTDDDMDGAAEHFQVSPLLIRTKLVNSQVLPRDTLPETF